MHREQLSIFDLIISMNLALNQINNNNTDDDDDDEDNDDDDENYIDT